MKLKNKYLEEDSDEENYYSKKRGNNINNTKLNDDAGIYVYSTQKANGENIQISYLIEFKAWIIGSKNVSMLLRDENDLNFYRDYENKSEESKSTLGNDIIISEFKNSCKKIRKIGTKYEYVIRFAELWFEIMRKNIEDKNLLEEFKSELDGFSIIGENIGDENHQHIKLYHEKDIHFYALIQNNSSRICAPFNKCKAFLDKYNLKMVQYLKSPLLKTKDELKEFMKKIYIETLNNNIEEGGEGSVIYFSKFENNQEEVIQLAKLKTFEYRFLRKLREKIRGLKSRNLDYKTIIHKIKKECEDILGEEGDSFDLAELLKFAEYVLVFVFKNGVMLNYEDQYAFFINAMKNSYKIHNKEVKLTEMNDDEKKLFEASKEKANFEIQKIMDRIQNGKIKFALNLENLNKPSTIDYEDLKVKCFNIKFKIGYIYIIANIGLVGSGKTTVCKIFENQIKKKIDEDQLNILYVSSDEIRYLSENNSFEEVSMKKIKNKFENQFKEFIKNAPETGYNIIIADKNFSMDTLVNFAKR
jgi:hypothetical protein